ncbi:hypothetical protein CDO52_00680 [Nocardiopsis gilva YIM 90087]|uniref:Uncharacterized protein n=1 Tax=Nocardiopsis gilva YIM 90087 TaxID=1235441 RepID=A0A223S054_9ACTN|nr:hypothetical protein [Nocardiopsis gilva]ASU81494.1 hypothetical protein CDO52_00680 [Nocardiopsis gilva YIM 90087]
MYESIVRTVVPVIVGVLLAQAARIGLDLPEGAMTEIVTVVVTATYYAVARLVEEHVSPLVGRLMLSAGLTRGRPVYGP